MMIEMASLMMAVFGFSGFSGHISWSRDMVMMFGSSFSNHIRCRVSNAPA